MTRLWPSLLDAGDHPALASHWFQNGLALEVAS
jgi:hypothetical protein